jgi:hypothetical protein
MKGQWWAHKGSNLGPLPCEGNALPLSYAPGIFVYRSKASNRPLARRTTPSERGIYEVRATGVKLSALNCVRRNAVLLRRINVIWAVQSPSQKYSRSFLSQITCLSFAIPAQHRGAFRDRHGRRAGDAMDAGGAKDEGATLRTAKSCGPDAPTLASSSREASFLRVSWGRRWQTSPITGYRMHTSDSIFSAGSTKM